MKKKGQYYLVAAIIFLGIFFILVSVANQSKKETNEEIYALNQEMKIESARVLEYFAYTGDNKIGNFTQKYSEYSREGGADIYYIVGNSALQEVYNYTEGEKQNLENFVFDPVEEVLNVTIKGREYLFNFEKGENFYFIISQSKDGEEYVLVG